MAAAAVKPPALEDGKGMEIDSEGTMEASSSSSASEGDLYTKYKVLQRQLEFLEIQVRALLRAQGGLD